MYHDLVVRVNEATASVALPNKPVLIQLLKVIFPKQVSNNKSDALLRHLPADTRPTSNEERTISSPVVPLKLAIFRNIEPSLGAEGGGICEVLRRPLDCVKISGDCGTRRDVHPVYGA